MPSQSWEEHAPNHAAILEHLEKERAVNEAILARLNQIGDWTAEVVRLRRRCWALTAVVLGLVACLALVLAGRG